MLKARSEALQAAEEEKELVLAEAAGQAASVRARPAQRAAGWRFREAESATTRRSIRLKQSSTTNAHH